MHLSHLYSSIMRGYWLISLVDVETSQHILNEVISGSQKSAESEVLSDRKPLTVQLIDKKMSATGGSETPPGTVAFIPVHGTMLKYGTYCAYGTAEIADKIYEAAADINVSGIVLDLDSGGGCVDAIAPLTSAIQSARDSGKSVVAFCDLCASACYYVAAYCDEIIASNDISAQFGSIGVMLSFADYAKYYENAGVKIHTVYSDLSEYKNAAFEAAKKGDYKSIKEEDLNPLARAFQDVVKQRRGKKLDLTVEGLLSGRMFYAKDALRVGLIDRIGSKKDAVNRAREIANDLSIQAYIHNKNLQA